MRHLNLSLELMIDGSLGEVAQGRELLRLIDSGLLAFLALALPTRRALRSRPVAVGA
jgi:hypothetical protein